MTAIVVFGGRAGTEGAGVRGGMKSPLASVACLLHLQLMQLQDDTETSRQVWHHLEYDISVVSFVYIIIIIIIIKDICIAEVRTGHKCAISAAILARCKR